MILLGIVVVHSDLIEQNTNFLVIIFLLFRLVHCVSRRLLQFILEFLFLWSQLNPSKSTIRRSPLAVSLVVVFIEVAAALVPVVVTTLSVIIVVVVVCWTVFVVLAFVSIATHRLD